MTTLTFGARLNAQSWAEALEKLPQRYSDADYGDEGLLGERLEVDLRQVGFADFVTLGHLLAFVRATSEAGAACAVRLPSAIGPQSEVPLDSVAANRRIRRHNCRRYLEQVGVVEALGRTVHPDSEADADVPAVPPQDDWARGPLRADPPHRARRILRYRWIPADDAQGAKLALTAAELERSWRELGLPVETSAAVTRGILLELLENAEGHGEAREILLGGVVVDPETYGSRADDFAPALRQFAKHAAVETNALIRLVVADIGRGMTLGTHGAAAIIRALDTRSAGAGTSAGTRGGGRPGAAQGLWKVSRVVRAHEGTLLISSRGHLAGRVCEEGTPRDTVGSAPAALPGTFVECAVLASPRDGVVQGAGELVTPRRRSGRGRGPRCLPASLTSPLGLRADDLDRLRAARGESLVVMINLPEADRAHDVEIGQAMTQVIEAAGEHEAGSVTLAFASVNRSLLSVAVEHLNAEHDERSALGTPGPPPVLVLAPRNRHYWVGGTAAQRRALGRLSSADGPLSAPPDASWQREEADAIHELVRHTTLLEAGEAAVTLRTLPQDAVAAMAQWTGEQIRATVVDVRTDPGHPDVWSGPFLTPALRVTSRWFDLDAMLSRLHLQALAGVSLAALVEDQLQRLDLAAPPRIVPTGHTPAEMLRAFASSLSGGGAGAPQRPDGAGGRDTAGPEPVLLVTDVVSSGVTVARALLDALERQTEPVIVAAVVDTRPRQERAAAPHHIELPSGKVPLVSLAAVAVDDAGRDDATLIDPVLRRPEIGQRPAPSQLIPQPQYVRAMQRNSAARLGHVERPADRHYSAYVDPTLLFREEEWSRAVLASLTSVIEARHHSQAGTGDATVCILYPEGTADDLGAAATLLQKALRNKGLDLAGDPVGVPRAAHALNWQLPRSFALPTVKHAVILDSGASSGKTVQQLIGLAADKDVSTITVVLLLNGMTDSDAVNLQRITTVRSSVADPPSEQATLEIVYVAKTAMGNVPGRRCAICALRRRYESAALHLPIPEALATHRQWLLRMLQPRTKQELFEEQAADLFGVNVSQPECVGYLTWRLMLREAALSTERRGEVVAHLDRARADPVIRDSLVRLLVAESHWLASAPLWFPECRAAIADLAASMLADNRALLIEQRLRVQAAILLAQSAPERFARDLTGILRANRGQGLVVAHILLEALLLITAPAASPSHAGQVVVRQLLTSLDDLLELLRSPGDAPPVASEFLTLPLVRYLLSHAVRALRQPPTDAQSAWTALREEIRAAGHDIANVAWMARTDIEFADAGEEVGDPEGIRDGWSSCANYLLDTVLPNVQPLRSILLSNVVLRDTPRELRTRWEYTLSAEGRRAVDETTVRVDDLVDRLKRKSRIYPDQTKALLADLEWWLRFVFDSRDGLLPKVIRRAPVDAVDVINRTFAGLACTVDASRLPAGHRDSYWVFCTNRLIQDVFSHILMNASDHHRIRGADQTFLIVLEEPVADRLSVTVFNDASTRETPGHGTGLDTLGHRLERFHGSLQDFDPEPPWTFAVAVGLERWKAER